MSDPRRPILLPRTRPGRAALRFVLSFPDTDRRHVASVDWDSVMADFDKLFASDQEPKNNG